MQTLAEMRDALRGLLRETPIGVQMEAEERERIATERRAVVAQLADAERASEAAVPGASNRLAAADAKLAKARAALKIAELERVAAYNALSSVSFRIARARQQAEHALRRTADPRIGEFISELAASIDATRSNIYRQTVAVHRNPYTDKTTATVRTNFASVAERVAALRAARRAAEQLMLDTDADVAARLDELRATIPELATETVTTGAAA